MNTQISNIAGEFNPPSTCGLIYRWIFQHSEWRTMQQEQQEDLEVWACHPRPHHSMNNLIHIHHQPLPLHHRQPAITSININTNISWVLTTIWCHLQQLFQHLHHQAMKQVENTLISILHLWRAAVYNLGDRQFRWGPIHHLHPLHLQQLLAPQPKVKINWVMEMFNVLFARTKPLENIMVSWLVKVISFCSMVEWMLSKIHWLVSFNTKIFLFKNYFFEDLILAISKQLNCQFSKFDFYNLIFWSFRV